MIYKVLYQKDQIVNPRREATKTLFLEADNVVAAGTMVKNNTPYNIGLIQESAGNSPAYEKQNPGFKLTTFKSEDK